RHAVCSQVAHFRARRNGHAPDRGTLGKEEDKSSTLEIQRESPVLLGPHSVGIGEPWIGVTRRSIFGRSLEDQCYVCLDCTDPAAASTVRSDRTTRRVVGPAAGGVPRPGDVHRLCDVGGAAGGALYLRSVPLAFLFP